MEKILISLVNWFVELLKATFEIEVAFNQMATMLATAGLVIIVILIVKLQLKNKKFKKLRRRVLNNEVQVVSVAKGKKGKYKNVIMTKADLRNPKKNNKTIKTVKPANVNVKTKAKAKKGNQGVTSINED